MPYVSHNHGAGHPVESEHDRFERSFGKRGGGNDPTLTPRSTDGAVYASYHDAVHAAAKPKPAVAVAASVPPQPPAAPREPVANSTASSAVLQALQKLKSGRAAIVAAAKQEAAGPLDPAGSFLIDREHLALVIKRDMARHKYCWTFPLGLFGFVLWVFALVYHASVQQAYSVEYGCV